MNAWTALERGVKRASLIWHRRAGKDDIALHHAAVQGLKRSGNYWHMLPEASQARKAIWDAVNPHSGRRRIEEAFPTEAGFKYRGTDMQVQFPTGSTWQVVGSDNYNSLVGAPPRGIVFSEWALADPSAWAYLAPILEENGGWAVFITTSRGRNHAFKTHSMAEKSSEWFAEILTAKDTPVFTQTQLDRQLEEYISLYGEDAGQALFDQEYMCSFDAAILGAYFGKEMRDAETQGRIGSVPYNPSQPVETWWDLGFGDATSIWFAQRMNGGAIHLIDFYEAAGVGFDHYKKVLDSKPYAYGRHIGPHDLENGDVGTGRKRYELAYEQGIHFEIAPRVKVKDDGIASIRAMLPMCFWNEKTTEKGVNALRQYRREYDKELQMYRPHPVHDWTSHPTDAFQTGAIARAPAKFAPIRYLETVI